MSQENQKPSPTAPANPQDNASPFLTEPLPQGTAQGQQQSLQAQTAQQSTAQNTQHAQNIAKYNLPRGAQTNNVGETTHFGYKTVNSEEKAQKVAEVFHSVAAKYDVMNDLMSFGIHRLWKRFAINMSGVRRGQQVLDIAGGTGDLAKVFSREVGPQGRVVLSDINESMLNVGRDRLLNAGCSNVDFVLANAETLEPFADNSFDLLTISFGLRNVTDKDAALEAMYRVLKPGGRLLILEFSKPIFEPFAKLYDLYSFTALPLMGKIVANDAESYKYLAESIRMHPDQNTLKGMMESAGFQNCDYHNLTGGIVAVHRGFKL
ncbi:bifunctional demethylmenaquinone methyltransferase/2-methoxy-6-polyprenyl-1,4-benzoquinol methylase UbiE [Acinetobacter larvae]|uniref:Ubiquinone/menaquinone biosynthesis C-methyltransferase UbiE n=1 Tax=Acinetobacter larvae TaxID=1789224 RepID=A0A1B2LW40_9GAMM|nr:bifunctional demethylmenaquinone methyltransferase/2-methoxy-6-polyprenyl-1,4-benzoquinol methylase UbiE [Acinetobacter larvae]AOA57166.1 bifunctional demethylmenaquinone methyltransferase/2-methoxy-6-polyprenyl-1,4-benzoquinol methylase [Acinetobacter larvae]